MKIESLNTTSNNISSVETTLLPNFLATNPRLKQLDLSENKLDAAFEFIANALGSNAILRHLIICENRVSVVGEGALRVTECD